jgi:hypothetical protein
MNLNEMLAQIHTILKQSCFSDIVEVTGVSPSCVCHWRNGPPEKPSLLVFSKLARYCGQNPTLKQLEVLL